MKTDNLKIVFIDWHKTLCSSMFFLDSKEEDEQLCKCYRQRTFVENGHLIMPWMVGEISKETVLQKIAPTKEEYEAAAHLLKKSCESMKLDSQSFLPLIQKIRQKGIKVAIATDNMDAFTDYVVPALNLNSYFDEIISSNLVGCTKQDVEKNKMLFFDDYLRKNNCKYEEAIMFDDICATVNLCKEYGMQGVCVESPQDLELALQKIAEE